MARQLVSVDVWIHCALSEEKEHVLKLFERVEGREQGKFRDGQPYSKLNVTKDDGTSLLVGFSFQSQAGPSETSEFVSNVLIPNVSTRYFIMCGICAGVQEKTTLGDVIVAERTFADEGGKSHNNNFEPEARLFEPSSVLTQWIAALEGSQWEAYLPEPKKHPLWGEEKSKKPLPMSFQVDYILNGLLTNETIPLSVYLACEAAVELCAKKDYAVFSAGPPSLTDTGRAFITERRNKSAALLVLTAHLPITDRPKWPKVPPPSCAVRRGTMASTGSVREDLPKVIGDLKQRSANRKIIAVDMEAAYFQKVLYFSRPYANCMRQALRDVKASEKIVIKSVCDFGDSWKDDHYHEFACQTSAAFTLKLLKTHIPSTEVREATLLVSPELRELLCEIVKLNQERKAYQEFIQSKNVENDPEVTQLRKQEHEASLSLQEAKAKVEKRISALCEDAKIAVGDDTVLKAKSKEFAQAMHGQGPFLVADPTNPAKMVSFKPKLATVSRAVLVDQLGAATADFLWNRRPAASWTVSISETLMGKRKRSEESQGGSQYAEPAEDLEDEEGTQWTTLAGSLIAATKWENGVLGIRLKDGSEQFYKAPETVFNDLKTARSPGAFYNKHIKGKLSGV